MKKLACQSVDSCYRSSRDSLEEVIARQQDDSEFQIGNWLEKLTSAQLRRIERDAQRCYDLDSIDLGLDTNTNELINITLRLYIAEKDFEISMSEAREYLDTLLIGLAVAACLERLKRAGWVIITGPMSIFLQGSRPYRVTLKGLQEGHWSHEPLTLWLLGAGLEHH